MIDPHRVRGSLLGLAVGDALGGTLEFKPPGTFEPIDDMVGGGPHRLRPGEWTDDTSMALCLAESLVERGDFDPVDQLERYVRWYRDGYLSSKDRCFDIGNTTREALVRFERTHEPYPGPSHDSSAGNGSIMRLAPVPLFFADHIDAAVERSGESSRTTHGERRCIDACRLLGAMIAAAVTGAAKDEVLADRFWRWGPLHPEVGAVARGSWRTKEPPAIRGSGYVVASLEAALWALGHADDFRSGALTAVNLGDDADTTGAVYGQLAGALFGEEGIPAEWRAKLARLEVIEKLADGLVRGPSGRSAVAVER